MNEENRGTMEEQQTIIFVHQLQFEWSVSFIEVNDHSEVECEPFLQGNWCLQKGGIFKSYLTVKHVLKRNNL